MDPFGKLYTKIQKDKCIRTLAVMMVLLIISLTSNRSIFGFVYWDGPYYGRIVDEETGVPIEGAAVAGIWNFEHLYLISIQNVATIKETITDKNGKFKLPLTFAFTLYPFSILEEMNLLVFKPGYDSHPTA
ncbi:MAG: carboxypeptidase-like regulatory domain-containing protein, partial [Bacteroidetes bacterium]|nr:carboxypeptidase-like regulatory domain-containing protein [Bacteroidota bacterium]